MGETSLFTSLLVSRATLQGAAITFAPLFLFEAGKGMFHEYDYLVAALCFAAILVVGFFYVRLGSEVIRELRNTSQRRFTPHQPQSS
ncbi:MAG: hypothetical protein WBY44_05690 [Bryobacteraceae bacterium]|jgi:hypothetical protein